jgi:chorismate mutase
MFAAAGTLNDHRGNMDLIARVVTAVVASTLLSLAACDPPVDAKPPSEPLLTLVDLAAQRVQVADTVAASKWGTDSSITDPVREQAVLTSATMKSAQLGIDPAISVRVFTDQIEANKAVQYALYSRWSAYPDQAPTVRPDLGRLRPILDHITDELLAQLKLTQDLRADPACGGQLASARQHIEQAHAFNRVHGDALGRATASLCQPPRDGQGSAGR